MKKGSHHSRETRQKLRVASRRAWDDPQCREKMIAGRKTPEYRARLMERVQERNSRPEYREKLRSAATNLWKKTSHRAKMRKAWENPERRRRFGEGSKRSWAKRKAKLAEAERIIANVLPFPEARLKKGRPRDPDTDNRIDLAGRVLAEGESAGKSVSQRSMSLTLFPDRKNTPEIAYGNTRKLFSDHRAEIEAAKNRHLAAKRSPRTDVS